MEAGHYGRYFVILIDITADELAPGVFGKFRQVACEEIIHKNKMVGLVLK
jgi:hypothetical protein